MGAFSRIFNSDLITGYNYDEIEGIEGTRLRTQAKLLYNFDMPVLREIFNTKRNCVILDVGCNEGDAALERLHGFEIAQYIGIDRSSVAIERAQTKYGDDFTKFYQIDVTSAKFDIQLGGLLSREHIDKVDVILVSMVLLHLEEPDSVLRALYSYLKPGGTIFVRDIDDRDNVAEPDSGNTFKRGYKIVEECQNSGNRTVGRRIGGWLIDAGYKNVKCVRRGLTSLGMSNEEKQALFDTYFGFFTPDAEAAVASDPFNERKLANLGWCHYNIPRIHDLFFTPGFTFTLGFITYVASKG